MIINMKNWENIEEAFAELNKKCLYIVLRNFEGFFDDILIPGHNDIDVLCAGAGDRKRMVKILGAAPRLSSDNGIHYKFLYNGKEIDLDIRTVGDGYYDKAWQKNMLRERVYNEKGFYTMDSLNYYYSLIYHAVYQKKELSEEYLIRLRAMGGSTGSFEKIDFEKQLFSFMKEMKYRYTMTYDEYVILYFNEELTGGYIECPESVKKLRRYDRRKEFVLGKLRGAALILKKFINK